MKVAELNAPGIYEQRKHILTPRYCQYQETVTKTSVRSRASIEVRCELRVPVRGHSEIICRLWNDKSSVSYAPSPEYSSE